MKLFLLCSDDRKTAAVVCVRSKSDVDMSKLPQFDGNIWEIGNASRNVPPGFLIANDCNPIPFTMVHNIQFENER